MCSQSVANAQNLKLKEFNYGQSVRLGLKIIESKKPKESEVMTGEKIKTALSGSTGRMGTALRELIEKSKDFEIRATANRKTDSQAWNPREVEGVIDFSLPPLFSKTLSWCVAHKKPLVSGTTGLSTEQKKDLKSASVLIPAFYEENMSWGIWFIKTCLSHLSGGGLKISLEDIHHKDKKDKPSGTALSLQKAFPPSMQKEIKTVSVRKGKEFGTHKLILRGEEEVVTLQHSALSRRVFAIGALKAFKWLSSKPPGLYSLKDIYEP